MKFKNNNFNKVDDISDFGITDPVTLKVKEFYEEYPFPNYKIDDNKYTLSQAGDRNTFSKKNKLELAKDYANEFEEQFNEKEFDFMK